VAAALGIQGIAHEPDDVALAHALGLFYLMFQRDAFLLQSWDNAGRSFHHLHPTVADFVLPQVLALTYIAHDMAPFACDLGYVDATGEVLPPFVWNEDERCARLAALDAVFFTFTAWILKMPPTFSTPSPSCASKTSKPAATFAHKLSCSSCWRCWSDGRIASLQSACLAG
jgi:hypothetical protein